MNHKNNSKKESVQEIIRQISVKIGTLRKALDPNEFLAVIMHISSTEIKQTFEKAKEGISEEDMEKYYAWVMMMSEKLGDSQKSLIEELRKFNKFEEKINE